MYHYKIFFFLFCSAIITTGINTTFVSATYDLNITKTEEDALFLSNMNQIWIPDIYAVSGKIDLAICSNDVYSGLINATIADAKVTLMADNEEMMKYNLTSTVAFVRSDYQNITFSTFRILNKISLLDSTSQGFEDNATVLDDIIPVYGNWISFRTMYLCTEHDVQMPDYASFPSEQIINVMEDLADTVTKQQI